MMKDQQLLRSFDVSIGTQGGRDEYRVLALSSMAAYSWALRKLSSRSDRLRSLVVKPARL